MMDDATRLIIEWLQGPLVADPRTILEEDGVIDRFNELSAKALIEHLADNGFEIKSKLN